MSKITHFQRNYLVLNIGSQKGLSLFAPLGIGTKVTKPASIIYHMLHYITHDTLSDSLKYNGDVYYNF